MQEIRGIKIQSIDNLETFIWNNDIEIVVLTVPRSHASEIAKRIVNAGVKAIWNFANTDLKAPDDVIVENVHLSESLMQLTFRIQNSVQEISA